MYTNRDGLCGHLVESKASYSIFVLDTTEIYLSVLSYWNPDHVYTKQFTRYNVQTQQVGLLGTFSFVSTTSTCGSTKVFQLQLKLYRQTHLQTGLCEDLTFASIPRSRLHISYLLVGDVFVSSFLLWQVSQMVSMRHTNYRTEKRKFVVSHLCNGKRAKSENHYQKFSTCNCFSNNLQYIHIDSKCQK